MTHEINLPPRQPKQAFLIDPLLNRSLEEDLTRVDGEIDAGELWKFRDKKFTGRWVVPLTLLALLPMLTEPKTTEALPRIASPVAADITTVVQACLQRFGYSVSVDGVYGQQTTKAVRHWQKVNGLVEDGVAGEQTLGSIRGAGCGNFVAPSVTQREGSSTRSVTPAPQGGWHDLAISVGWSEAHWGTLSCIIDRESRGIPTAQNRSGATGLLQILRRYHPNDNLTDPAVNLTVGLAMFRERGWQPWTAGRGIKQCF